MNRRNRRHPNTPTPREHRKTLHNVHALHHCVMTSQAVRARSDTGMEGGGGAPTTSAPRGITCQRMQLPPPGGGTEERPSSRPRREAKVIETFTKERRCDKSYAGQPPPGSRTDPAKHGRIGSRPPHSASIWPTSAKIGRVRLGIRMEPILQTLGSREADHMQAEKR